jgi:hypothetical protein
MRGKALDGPNQRGGVHFTALIRGVGYREGSLQGFVMDKVNIDLKHCYGIRSLKHEFDFSKTTAYAIYAPNGAMKSSLALTFKDLSSGAKPKDRIFPDRVTTAIVTDEKGSPVEKDRVLVVLSYDEGFAPSEKTCTLLVDPKLRTEFAGLQVKIDEAKKSLLSVCPGTI